MRKSVLAVMAAGSVFALTAAGAATLNLTGSGLFSVTSRATANVNVYSCSATVTYSFVTLASPTEDTIDQVVLSASNSNCNDMSADVQLDSNGIDSAKFTGSMATIDVSPDYKPAGTSMTVSIDVYK